MERLSFNSVKVVEGVVLASTSEATDVLLTKYARRLAKRGVKTVRLPSAVKEKHEFRMKAEHVSGALIDIAKLRTNDLFKGNSNDVNIVLRTIDTDVELNSILETIVSLNGHQGLGHSTIREIATFASKSPTVIASVKARLEKKINKLVDECYEQGRRTVMDIVRHVAPPQRQCIFAVV